ncbi:hypothetical protein EV182_000348 [Spiromyces aspiralis]|uniref:Uncharacterized protein n=1 Tax=Spiromyces aspiralis TaxID=68401 RepID=A0ACC1HI76_9FUNG|nr:hypothetical protein EV182_000348 [Spiromyces aspiralis]
MSLSARLVAMLHVPAIPETVVMDGITWDADPTASSNWENYYYSGYQRLVDGLKSSDPAIYSELTSVLKGSDIPSTYDPEWVSSANNALLDWQATAFQPGQLEPTYAGLPIPAVTVVYVDDDSEEKTGTSSSSGGSNNNSGGFWATASADSLDGGRGVAITKDDSANHRGGDKSRGPVTRPEITLLAIVVALAIVTGCL